MTMSVERPNPDELLARVRADEERAHRGRLKIFFGYAAGVGKTFAMLEAARRERAEGVDVVVGYVEPHGRPETEALLEGLETIPPRQVPYRGVMLREFDLDAALARKPKLILVDELAHTNAEGSRHAKRWQDVEELLEAGIDVYSTLNVQHIESLNDVIAQITGVVVRETLPDAVLERADEIELIDLTPEELMERLREGKVYVPVQAERALHSFFQKSNLVALREISLRQTANRLRRDVEAARQDRAVKSPWATGERLLVCVGPSPTTARIIRNAKRMADAFGADWLAVAVDTKGAQTTTAKQEIARHLGLAEQLGAETHTLVGEDVARTVLDYARSRNVTKLVVGKTAQPLWKRMLFGTVVDQLLEASGDIDVYVIQGEAESAPLPRAIVAPAPFDWRPYLHTAGVIALCGLIGWLCQYLELAETNIVMVFLLGVAFVATRYGRGPAAFASVAGVLVFDFFFVPPYLTFAVSDAEYLITFAIMLAIGLLISTLTARVREQLRASQQQERHTAALYRLTKQLSEVVGTEFLIQSAGRQLGEIFTGEVVLYVREETGQLQLRFGESTSIVKTPVNAVVAQWVAEHEHVAGAGTDTLPNATALFVPLVGSQRTVGALGVRPQVPGLLLDPDQRQLLETCASLIALSIERDQSVLQAHQAQLQVQAEQLRSSLLSSVSHDLRTPLAAIAGAATSLLEQENTRLKPGLQQELLYTIVEESRRLARLVDNLLDMTRLESGAVAPNRQWHVLEEIIGSVRTRLHRELDRHPLRVQIEEGFPLLHVDGLLLEQVFVNLLENAGRYTPDGSPIEISAVCENQKAVIRVSDAGPGLPPGSEEQVFDKFFRGGAPTPDGRRGVGLGLAICQAIIKAHGGWISASNRPTGGAEFTITLPCDPAAPRVVLDETPESGGRSQESEVTLNS
jgi:two-component system sensor histidine kinase KdpD